MGSAPITITGKVVVFDYGEVISAPPLENERATLLRLAGADPERFWPAYGRHRDGLDQGTLSIGDYWRHVADDLGAEFGDTLIDRLWAADVRSWLSVDEGTLGVLDDLAAGGTRLALLSNAGADFGAFFRNGSISRFFEAVFVSGELGIIKPDARIFEHALRHLGISPAQAVFIDNKEKNVRGAERLGITGHVFTGAEGLRAFLTSLAAAG